MTQRTTIAQIVKACKKLARQTGLTWTTNKTVRLNFVNGDDFCPITAACFQLQGKHFGLGEVDRAGEALGISENLIRHMITAADADEPGMLVDLHYARKLRGMLRRELA